MSNNERCKTVGCENPSVEEGYCKECVDISPSISNDTGSDIDTNEYESDDTDSTDSFKSASSHLSHHEVREYHRRIGGAVESLGTLDGNPTLLVNDKSGWYVTRDNTDPGEDEVGEYPKERRSRNFDSDYRDVVNQPLERTLYALTSYKYSEAFNHWEPARFDSDAGQYEYLNRKPTPTIEDTVAVSAWGDIDLADELKPQRFELSHDTYATVEAALEAYIGAFADLYGGRDAVYALDSVGGAYVFGAPEATLPISQHYEGDDDARERIFSAFIERTNKYLQEAEETVNERVEGASEAVHPDWANNVNRQYKIPLTIHGNHDAVVTPLDVGTVRYREPTRVEDVDDDLLDDVWEWTEVFTAVEHTDRVESLVATLWPEEYEERGSWDAALDTWVESEREAERREEQRRQAARERREKRMDELGGDLGGQPITPFMEDVYDALDAIDTGDVIQHYASDAWDTGTDAGSKTEFDPSWRESSSGTSCYVDHNENRFGDAGQHGGGYAAKAMALGQGIIHNASADLSGQQWAEAVDALRNAGYDVPTWIPEKGSQRCGGGEYEEMPFWAVKKTAVALSVLPEDAFERKTGSEGGEYYGFPGPETYNNVLDAIEDAGLDHGRERADTGPRYPVYELDIEGESVDLELYLRPVGGKRAEIAIMRDGNEVYSETEDRGFWNNRTKRGRIAGGVNSAIQGVDGDALRDAVKNALVGVSTDSKADWFDEAMRSNTEQDLRDRTTTVICWPGEERTEWVITMLPPVGSQESEPQTFTFDDGQLTNADPGHFRSLHTGAFFEKLDIDPEEWANLTTYWLDIQETKEREADPRKEAAIEEFLSKVEVMTVWAEESGFNWRSRNGLYQPDYVDDKDAILIPGRWIVDWQNDSDYGDLNLSKILREREIMVSEAKKVQVNGKQNRAWPVAASKTEHTYQNAHRPQEADDDDAPEDLR